MSGEEEKGFEDLLHFLQNTRGFDFRGYKRPSLMRRVQRRMQMVGIEAFGEYADYLQVHPEEFELLFNTILINVTTFFRDPEAWEALKREVVPAILASKAQGEPVRIWSAGCASGEEAYSIAMLLCEAMGDAAFRERVKVYATDADEQALGQARAASYAARELEDLDAKLRDKYFEPANGRHVFRGDLRRAVIFGRHDLVQDAPISRLDLIVCRNTLMYFNAETQASVLARFHFALNGEGSGAGYLFLGRAEMMLAHASLFAPVDLKCRIFAKIPSPSARARIPVPAATGNGNGNGGEMARTSRLREQALEESPMARLVVDANGTMILANGKARMLFSISPRDVGRPLKDLEISYRPVELRSMIEQAYAEKRVVTQTSVERRFPDGELQYFDVVVAPVLDEGSMPLGVGITFLDVTRTTRLQEELRVSREEIATTNEELQSSNEELETTNEELQSTNEELETMNEELQSTNEELQTVNEELRQRTDELNVLNAFFESVLGSISSAAVVVNQAADVLMWNSSAEDLWGLRADEVQGRNFLGLDIGLPVGELRAPIRQILAGEAPKMDLVVDAITRRGKKMRCRVACTPLLTGKGKREGVIMLMEAAA